MKLITGLGVLYLMLAVVLSAWAVAVLPHTLQAWRSDYDACRSGGGDRFYCITGLK